MPLSEVISFLERHEMIVVEEFKKSVIVSGEDPYKERIHLNGQAMYQLVVGFFRSEVSMEEVKQLAYKVAMERIQADVNIGDFVHNVCSGRNLILKYLLKSELPSSVLLSAILKMDECFDHFLVHAVSRYTELKNGYLAEKQLFIERSHKDRLTLLGQMASSFVHEFRNPLTSIIGFAKLLKRENPSLPYVDIIENELSQLNYRISQFLLVSKKDVLSKRQEHFALDGLIEEILAFLYPTIVDVNVQIDTDVDPTLHLTGYREEIKQVLVNIISNAIEALHNRQEQKKIRIVAFQTDQGKLRIAIVNNGTPIPDDVLPVIFEPFFSTKELGTGIGLFVCKEIVEAHGGRLWCQSSEQETTFFLEFEMKASQDRAG